MPTYQYQCEACGHELEEFQSMTEEPLVRCPSCNGESLVRVLGTGAGLIFKGSGFYLTDYRKGPPPKEGDTKPEGKTQKKENPKKGPSSKEGGTSES
jgi:putative FmdB family regulatory protein